MEFLSFKNPDEAKEYFKLKAWDYYISVLLSNGIDVMTIFDLDIQQLTDFKLKILEFKSNKTLTSQYTARFYRKFNYTIADMDSDNFHPPVTFTSYLNDLIQHINERIIYLEEIEKVTSIKKLVSQLPETEVKEQISLEINELETKKVENEIKIENEREKLREQIEFGKHKADMFEKRTNVFLKFLDRESVASIVGSLLLLTMGVCLIIMMFRHEEPLKIIESAFLLILGYFFGHSKNNK